MGRLAKLWPTSQGERLAVAALGLLLMLGVGIRLLLVISRNPTFMGAGDGLSYIGAARSDLFGPATHPMGYHLFVRTMHALWANLTFMIVVQHALGVATALLLFSTVRRVAPLAWGLLPAGLVLLNGSEIFLEHSPVTESPFIFLVALICYCTVRALEDSRRRWMVVAGLASAVAGTIRPVGLLLLAWTVVWTMASVPGGLRRRLLATGALALSAWMVLAVYVTAARFEAGYVGPGLTRQGGWVQYARVAPFADCGRFTPPPLTEGLCETRPPSERETAIGYMQAGTAARTVFGGSIQPREDRALSAFARSAILHQPVDYLRAVTADLGNFWSANGRGDDTGFTYDMTFDPLVNRPVPALYATINSWYSTGRASVPNGVPGVLDGYERRTRIQGPALVVLAAIALLGLLFTRGNRFKAQLFLVGVSAVLIVGPVALLYFDARYAIPGFGILAAAAAIGAAELWARASQRVRRKPAVTV